MYASPTSDLTIAGTRIRFRGGPTVTLGPVDESSLSLMSAWLSSSAAVVAAGLFGAIWGSFLNVCIARVPLGQSVVRPGSRCMACKTPVRAADNIPILSYFLLRGRCRSCGARFSARYALVELLTAAIAAAIFWRFVADDPGGAVAVRLSRFALYFAFSGALIVLSFIDLDTGLLPDLITLPAIPILFLAAFGAHDVPALERAIGAAAGYLFIRLIADFYYYVLGREGMGLGDGKLLAMIGALLGWKSLPIVMFAGSFLGVLISLPILIAARRKGGDGDGGDPSLRRAKVRFGPFLALGALIYLFAGRAIVSLLMGDV
jgi:leader peptidase (prepilin peptidase)/N-methyltransferase